MRPARAPLLAPVLASLTVLCAPALAWASGGEHAGPLPPVWSTAFFVTMLLAIAILPLTKAAHWWEHNLNKLIVSGVLAVYPLIYLLVLQPNVHELLHTLEEYVSFIILLGTLFYITGGILLTGDLKGTPATNTTFLAIGTLAASFVGTTGASMLLIRPVLRANAQRRECVHVVVFFIFLVSNVGGSLLPIGDPPLFLGYLKGVPFLWTLNLFPQFAMVSSLLLVLFYLLDTRMYRREGGAAHAGTSGSEPLRLEGKINLLWLLGIVLCVALIRSEHGPFVREIAMIACAVASRLTTPKDTRERNSFTWSPILEVAALFIGIFLTMIPALMLLRAEGSELGVDSPAKFFWVSGFLSSFLDNAPTYLVFFNTARGMVEQGLLGGPLVEAVGIPVDVLLAISVGSVFMGANTYIGNGPNFMVKAIAEEQKVRMPSFFGYMRWSVAILIPCFVLVTLVFFR